MDRRQFLKGVGGFYLALPFLPSLAPSLSQAASVEKKKRFVAIVHRLGYYENQYYPTVAADQRFADDVYYKTLSSISGDLSPAFGKTFDALKSKMNIYRGLDVVGAAVHSFVPALCACKDDDGARGLYSTQLPTGTSKSIDSILAGSSNFYSSSPAFRALRGEDPAAEEHGTVSFSFDRNPTNGERIRITAAKNPKAIFDQVFFGRNLSPSVQGQVKAGKLFIGDLVLEHYKKLTTDRRIGAVDKNRLENFMEHLHETHKNVNSQGSITCSSPTIPAYPATLTRFTSDAQIQNFFKNYFDVMLAAMACDLTRVGVINIGRYLHDHALSHADINDVGNQTKYIALTKVFAGLVKDCVQKMNSVIESDGSNMLDNSLVYWTYEMGESSIHSTVSMPAISFGSAGGNIKTGYYMDYRQRPFKRMYLQDRLPHIGRSYTQLFVTFMRALGLPQDEILKYGDGKGFGSFSIPSKWWADHAPYEAFRNQVLPFISNVA